MRASRELFEKDRIVKGFTRRQRKIFGTAMVLVDDFGTNAKSEGGGRFSSGEMRLVMKSGLVLSVNAQSYEISITTMYHLRISSGGKIVFAVTARSAPAEFVAESVTHVPGAWEHEIDAANFRGVDPRTKHRSKIRLSYHDMYSMVQVRDFSVLYFDDGPEGRANIRELIESANDKKNLRGIIKAFEKIRLNEWAPKSCTPDQVGFAADLSEAAASIRRYWGSRRQRRLAR